MKHAVPHDLDAATAKTVTEKAWEAYSTRFSQYNPTISWPSENQANVAFRAKGLNVSGTLELKPRRLKWTWKYPFAAAFPQDRPRCHRA